MIIFIVQYTENENNTFAAWRIKELAQWDAFLITKLPNNLCGYLITDRATARLVPTLQARKFLGYPPGVTQHRDREALLDEFENVLRKKAVDMTPEMLKDMERATRKKTEPQNKSYRKRPPMSDTPKSKAPRFKVPKDATITVLATENPRRKGSKTYDVFNLYKNGMPVSAFLEKGGRMVDLKADVERGHVKIEQAAAA